MNQYKYVLACIDLSNISEKVLRRAREFASFYDAHLVVLYANESMPAVNEPFGEPPSLIFDAELREVLEKRAMQELELLTKKVELSELVPVEIIDGHPKSVILDYLEEHPVDLIVMGKHQRPALLDILGSTANAVMHKAKIDVFMVTHN